MRVAKSRARRWGQRTRRMEAQQRKDAAMNNVFAILSTHIQATSDGSV